MIGGVELEVVRKDVKNISIRILAPDGDVRVTAPRRTSDTTIKRIVTERLDWIRTKQEQVRNAPRVPALEVKTGETHYVWGKPYLLEVVRVSSRTKAELVGGAIRISVPTNPDVQTRQAVLDRFYRKQMETVAHELITHWQARMGVSAGQLTIRKMTTRWGTCNTKTGKITLNLELAKRDPRFLEYVVIHELAHLIERGHTQRFYAVMDEHLPNWRELRRGLAPGTGTAEPQS